MSGTARARCWYRGGTGSHHSRFQTPCAPALSAGCSWPLWRRQRTEAVWLHREEAR